MKSNHSPTCTPLPHTQAHTHTYMCTCMWLQLFVFLRIKTSSFSLCINYYFGHGRKFWPVFICFKDQVIQQTVDFTYSSVSIYTAYHLSPQPFEYHIYSFQYSLSVEVWSHHQLYYKTQETSTDRYYITAFNGWKVLLGKMTIMCKSSAPYITFWLLPTSVPCHMFDSKSKLRLQ